MLEVCWVGGFEGHPSAVTGVRESEGYSVQPLAVEPEARVEFGVGAVHGVTAAGVVECGKVDADLVGAAGFQVDF